MMQKGFFPNPYAPFQEEPSHQEHFKEFDATELFCPKCGRSMPVRKRLLLILPEGEKYEYLCAFCSTSVGSKVVREKDALHVLA